MGEKNKKFLIGQRQENPWYGTSSNAAELISGQRN